MSRSVWSRVVAAFIGLWFVAVAAGPELMHACPTHGEHAEVSATDGTNLSHAGHEGHRAASSTPDQSSVPTDGGGACTCLGDCAGTGPVAVLAALAEFNSGVTVAERDAGLPDYAYVPAAAQHVLPFAQGPPLSA